MARTDAAEPVAGPEPAPVTTEAVTTGDARDAGPDVAPMFSSVVPTYDRAGSIRHTLESCFAQSWADFEVVVVDDGSSDATLELLRTIEDPRLRVVAQANAGPAAARNHGMRVARGRHVAFLDSDDVWFPDFLERAREALVETPTAMLYGRIVVDRGVGRYWIKPDRALAPDESIYDYLYADGQFVQTSTIVVPSALADRVRWEESVTFGDNDQFAIDCWRAGATLRMLPEAKTLYADATSADALSQLPVHARLSEKHRNFFTWMSGQREHMSERAWLGYRARFESVALARVQPLESLRALWQAYRGGVIGIGGVARQLVQNYAPRLYRRLTDQYVRRRGLTPAASGLPIGTGNSGPPGSEAPDVGRRSSGPPAG